MFTTPLKAWLLAPVCSIFVMLITTAFAYPPPPACDTCDCFESKLIRYTLYDNSVSPPLVVAQEWIGWREKLEDDSTVPIEVAFSGDADQCGPSGNYPKFSDGRYYKYTYNNGSVTCTSTAETRKANFVSDTSALTSLSTTRALYGCGD